MVGGRWEAGPQFLQWGGRASGQGADIESSCLEPSGALLGTQKSRQ